MARRLIVVAVVLLVAVGGAFAVFALRGSDAPPPPTLSREDTATATTTPTPAAGATAYEVTQGEDTFVGYRVREEFASIGVADAVGRTPDVIGAAEIDGDRITSAELEADMTTLVSDESRRDDALRERGIETARYPRAEFRLTEPVDLSRRTTTTRGELTLHGETQPIRVRVSAQRLQQAVELAGSARIAFADFGIEPPSVAGVVTVEDQGMLEFKLRLRPAA